MQKAKNGVRMSIYLDADMSERLKECADKERRSVSAQIEVALEEFFERQEEAAEV